MPPRPGRLPAAPHGATVLSTGVAKTISGGIMGAGIGRRLAEVRWNVATRMAVGRLVTLPSAAVVAAAPPAVRSGRRCRSGQGRGVVDDDVPDGVGEVVGEGLLQRQPDR